MTAEVGMVVVDQPITFENLVGFQIEVASPLAVKRELDALVARLNRSASPHANRVITRVVGRDALKRTVEMQVLVPLRSIDGAQGLIGDGSRYFLQPNYEIAPGYRISIPNDQALFRRAVETFLECSSGTSLEGFDAGRQSIIEVSRIDRYGSVLGFDLYLEVGVEGSR